MKYQINGKIEDNVDKIKGLQELIGLKAKNVFGVKTVDDLDEKMSEMALIDLQKLAVSCGISGGGSRAVLKSKIRNEFIKFLKGSHGLSITRTENMKIKGKDGFKKEREIHRLMTEGL